MTWVENDAIIIAISGDKLSVNELINKIDSTAIGLHFNCWDCARYEWFDGWLVCEFNSSGNFVIKSVDHKR